VTHPTDEGRAARPPKAPARPAYAVAGKGPTGRTPGPAWCPPRRQLVFHPPTGYGAVQDTAKAPTPRVITRAGAASGFSGCSTQGRPLVQPTQVETMAGATSAAQSAKGRNH